MNETVGILKVHPILWPSVDPRMRQVFALQSVVDYKVAYLKMSLIPLNMMAFGTFTAIVVSKLLLMRFENKY